MAKLRKRMSSQGITLEQFAFQFVVVLLGVYLAILFESKAEDRSRAADARAMLVSVLAEPRRRWAGWSRGPRPPSEPYSAGKAR